MGALEIRDVPIRTAVDPHAQFERGHEIGDGDDQLLGEDALFDHCHVAVDQEASVEGGDRRLQVKGPDEHLHPSGRTAARDCEEDARLMKAVHSCDRPVGEDLFLRDEGAVDVGEH